MHDFRCFILGNSVNSIEIHQFEVNKNSIALLANNKKKNEGCFRGLSDRNLGISKQQQKSDFKVEIITIKIIYGALMRKALN